MTNDLIIAVFNSTTHAHQATAQIASRGFSTDTVSIITRDSEGMTDDSVADGAVSGAALGGLGGLLLGAGTLAIPGFGLLAAAGPIAGLLTGATAGGIIGALVDYGIPEDEASAYEYDLQNGKIVWTMHAQPEDEYEIKEILRQNGAEKV